MNGNQHAPEPWDIVNLDTDGVCISTASVRRGSYYGAAITSHGQTLALVPHADSKHDANLRLIACAPTLLALVQEMIGDKRIDAGDWIGRARAAVEEATQATKIFLIIAPEDEAP
jgi:hypothetical protein